jgi:hypothetical protein
VSALEEAESFGELLHELGRIASALEKIADQGVPVVVADIEQAAIESLSLALRDTR